jgi:hypothetical protein
MSLTSERVKAYEDVMRCYAVKEEVIKRPLLLQHVDMLHLNFFGSYSVASSEGL